jgi:ribokinase
VTYGAKGAEFVSGGESHKVAAHKVEVADTTGAGDTFFGGFMAQYANGATVSDALEFASAMAALQVQSLGAAVAIPSRDAVLDFLNG